MGSEDAFELYRQGLKRHRAKDYEGAVALLERAVAADAGLADAWEALGVLFEKLGRLDDAITAMERLAALQPDQVMAHTNLSRFYMKKGMRAKAEEEQGKARLLGWKQELSQGGPDEPALQQSQPAAEPQAPSLVTLLGAGGAPLSPARASDAGPESSPQSASGAAPPLAANREALERKIAQFERLVAHDAQDVLSRFTLGRAYLEAGRAEDSIRVLEELLALKPDYTAAYVLLGEAFEKAGRLARAIKTWTRGVELAQQKGDLQPRNEMQERLRRLSGGGARPPTPA
jgi:tetratricopeptide (TPR) repeat protein